MEIHYVRRVTIALSALAGGLISPMAQAQSVIFANPFAAGHQYALLNGDAVALYVNDRGDIGSPYRSSGIAKPNGYLDSNGQPFINADGSVNTSVNIGGVQNGTYGLLITPTPMPSTGSIGDSVRAKSEYLTVGAAPSTVAEGFALTGDNSRLKNGANWLNASSFNVNSFTTLNNGGLGVVSQLFRQTGAGAQQGLQLTQTITISPTANQVSFNLQFTNTDAQPLTNLHYARAVNPNQGGTAGSPSPDTLQTFGSPDNPKGFILNSTAGQRQLGLTVTPGQPNTMGARVTVASDPRESVMLSNPDRFFTSNNAFVTLGSGNAATYNVGDGTTVPTNDFTSDPNFRPDFGTLDEGDFGMILESGIFSLQPGETQDFNFYLQADPRRVNTAVPEPGAFALLSGGLMVGILLRRRRRA